MVERAIVSFFEAFINIAKAIVRLFPAADQAIDIIAVETYAAYISWAGNIIDITAFSLMVTAIISFELGMMTFRVGIFIWRLLPFT